MTTDFPTIETLGDRLGPAVVRQFETISRAAMRGPGAVIEDGFCRIVTGENHPLGNYTVVSDPADLEATRSAVKPLCVIEAPSAVIFPGVASGEVDAFLGKRGYAIAERMPGMAVDLDKVGSPELPADHELVEIDPVAHRDVWNDVLAAGYGIPRPIAELFGPGIEPRDGMTFETRYFAVMTGGGIVATSMVFLEGGLAGIYCVATLPEHRGKGLGACVTAEPLRCAREDGYRVGILQSSAMGESVYRRLGFEPLGVMPLYVRMPVV